MYTNQAAWLVLMYCESPSLFTQCCLESQFLSLFYLFKFTIFCPPSVHVLLHYCEAWCVTHVLLECCSSQSYYKYYAFFVHESHLKVINSE